MIHGSRRIRLRIEWCDFEVKRMHSGSVLVILRWHGLKKFNGGSILGCPFERSMGLSEGSISNVRKTFVV